MARGLKKVSFLSKRAVCFASKSFSISYASLRAVYLLIQKYFCIVYDFAGKEDLDIDYWNPERKLGVVAHFQR